MRRVNSTVGMSGEIEQVVTKLLRTTKALLEALTQWSLMRASNSEIFDIHDTLEKQFFLVSQAFEEASVSMSDLQWIPRQLRDSVSVAMLEPPSPAGLDQYLPRIREVIVHLLHGLKGKQALLRERERERESRGSIRSNNTDSWNREVPLAALNRGSSSQRIMMHPQPPSSPPLPPHPPISPRMAPSGEYEPWSGGMPRPSMPTNDLSSRIMPRNSSSAHRSYSPSNSPNMQKQPLPLPTRSTSSNRSNPAQQMPSPPPPPPPPIMPAAAPTPLARQDTQSFDESDPNTASALAALKRQENLARRSSVRRASMFRAGGEYSGGSISRGKGQQMFQPAYESSNVPPVPSLPTHNHLPLKNVDYTVATPTTAPTPTSHSLNTVSEAKEEDNNKDDGVLTLFLQIGKEVQKVQYTGEISIPALNMLFLEKFSYSVGQNDFPKIYVRDPVVDVSYELVDLSEVRDKSILSFNINDKEDQKESQKEWLSEVTTAFNKELSETRRMFTEQMDEIKKQIVESNIRNQEADEEKERQLIQQVTTHILSQHQPLKPPPAAAAAATAEEEPEDEPKEEKETTLVQEAPATPAVENAGPIISKEQFEAQRKEIETLRRDVAVLRQLERELREGTASVVSEIKEKAEKVKEEAIKKADAELNQTSTARSHLEEGKKNLLDKSDKVTSRLEDLQDTIDQLKLDVTQRKCRPSEAQMTHCANERKALAEEIEEFGKYIAQVKPRWKKTWELELQTIVKEQQTLKDQEYLLSDMKDDLDALLEVFEQLEKIYAYQANTKPQPREFRVAPAEEGFEGMSSVFKQVSTIDVDHTRRLRALEQAEKMRQRELANRIDDFEKELVGFVDSKKLKKTGGAMEIDRLRKQKDEEMMKAMYAEKRAAAGSGASTPSVSTVPEENVEQEQTDETAAAAAATTED
ncbi:Phosphatidylinositol 4-kinase pik1alpha (PI4-kinase)(PtdIns-4-kinase) [Mucor velutinosus]|uniref:Phosphatidylinositol 4-kinase pik1alpha (PI4-kinase)(PtdIns-4-kinase) n=1 Tax=Mucor velutinosus TaxID=708070 RepID=A0AAN7I0F1_9FUNG|nr:Phosphatidylinositol 4-kinase pik1alpha (PI4-kinase)(PtdIns-4-kinase) [Mucor velutinosus]